MTPSAIDARDVAHLPILKPVAISVEVFREVYPLTKCDLVLPQDRLIFAVVAATGGPLRSRQLSPSFPSSKSMRMSPQRRLILSMTSNTALCTCKTQCFHFSGKYPIFRQCDSCRGKARKWEFFGKYTLQEIFGNFPGNMPSRRPMVEFAWIGMRTMPQTPLSRAECVVPPSARPALSTRLSL